jgi:hypothetical protein
VTIAAPASGLLSLAPCGGAPLAPRRPAQASTVRASPPRCIAAPVPRPAGLPSNGAELRAACGAQMLQRFGCKILVRIKYTRVAKGKNIVEHRWGTAPSYCRHGATPELFLIWQVRRDGGQAQVPRARRVGAQVAAPRREEGAPASPDRPMPSPQTVPCHASPRRATGVGGGVRPSTFLLRRLLSRR